MTTMAERASRGSLRVVGAMLTDIGRVRSTNEDTVAFVAPAEGTPEEIQAHPKVREVYMGIEEENRHAGAD